MHHQGEPVARKSWMLEHMEEPPVVHQQQQYFHQQPEQQPPVEPIVAEPQPEMTRQEERAQARKDARTMNPKKEAKEDDSIWEVEIQFYLFIFLYFNVFLYIFLDGKD